MSESQGHWRCSPFALLGNSSVPLRCDRPRESSACNTGHENAINAMSQILVSDPCICPGIGSLKFSSLTTLGAAAHKATELVHAESKDILCPAANLTTAWRRTCAKCGRVGMVFIAFMAFEALQSFRRTTFFMSAWHLPRHALTWPARSSSPSHLWQQSVDVQNRVVVEYAANHASAKIILQGLQGLPDTPCRRPMMP